MLLTRSSSLLLEMTLLHASWYVREYVTVPEKRDLNEANFVLRYKSFKNVCHIETNVNSKLH